jgi:hypothetical protein
MSGPLVMNRAVTGSQDAGISQARGMVVATIAAGKPTTRDKTGIGIATAIGTVIVIGTAVATEIEITAGTTNEKNTNTTAAK